MKRFCILALILALCLSLALPVMAQQSMPRLVDQANLLNDSEEATVLSALDAVSEAHGVDVVVVTADALGGQSPMDYADDFYDDNGYSSDGILLLVSMEDRDWWISTTGYGITVFTDAGIEYLSEQFVPWLSDGDYAAAFGAYAAICDTFITQAETGDPYDTHNLPKEPFGFFGNLLICLVVGFVVALIATAIMKGKLKSVHAKSGAADYVKAGSMNVTHRQDLFLYREVHKREKPKDSGGSSTHRSSSGRSHGGGGGKF